MLAEREPMEVVIARYQAWRPTLLALRREGDHRAAIAAATSAVELLEQNHAGLAYVVEAAMDLGSLYGSVEDWAAAEPWFADSVRYREAVFGERGANTATAKMMLAVAKLFLGAYEEAEELLVRCLSIRREIFGPSHPQVALVLSNLAAVYEKTGRDAEAKPLRDQAERMGVSSLLPPQA